MRIQVLDEAEDDLQDGREFYDRQERGVGEYFATALAADIDSLILFAGIHPMEFEFHRALSKRFPFGVYYLIEKRSSAFMQCSISGATRHGFAADSPRRNDEEIRCVRLRPHVISNPQPARQRTDSPWRGQNSATCPPRRETARHVRS